MLGRYFTVTGDLLPGGPDEIVNAGELGGPWDRMVCRLRKRSNVAGENREALQGTGQTQMSDRLSTALEKDARLQT